MAGRIGDDAETYSQDADLDGQQDFSLTMKPSPMPKYDSEDVSIPFIMTAASYPFNMTTIPPQGSQKTVPSQQPTPEVLAQLGIKVRDFAYESTLPPIAPIPRVPRQMQPGPRPLKRAQRDWDDGNDDSSTSSRCHNYGGRLSPDMHVNAGQRKSKSLERKVTEPLEPIQSLPSRRTLGFTELSQYRSNIPGPSAFAPAPRASARSFSNSPPTSPLNPPSFQDLSQESESIVTPVSSPNNSIHWNVTDVSLIPASQLDTESQAYCPEMLSYSQMGLSPAVALPVSPAISPVPARASPPRPTSIIPSDPFTNSSLLGEQPTNSPSPSGHADRNRKPSTASSPSTPARYLLRRRSQLSSHTPTRSRYPHPHPYAPSARSSPSKKGSQKTSTRPRRIRNGPQESLITR
ncbi:hypothetical protein BJ138DRAFT_1139973 [Hygrophoropsis aurantiaca]|uniref:Uncharacterized protein n=1 Tax=Hygrophoropsis aurantiaca TaxID=72124 RepID=A0ACB8ASR3_9AGAM|nr:hypothetical protein BJ138DRAFT_1139973 [Hygrophoropsis aurantiaca]